MFLVVGNGKTVVLFEAFMQFGGGFVKQENTAREHNHVLAGNGEAADLEQQPVSVMMCAIKASIMMRMTTASPSPIIRARSRRAGWTLFAKIATKTRLSIPNTTSTPKRAKTLSRYAVLPITEIHDFHVFLKFKREKAA